MRMKKKSMKFSTTPLLLCLLVIFILFFLCFIEDAQCMGKKKKNRENRENKQATSNNEEEPTTTTTASGKKNNNEGSKPLHGQPHPHPPGAEEEEGVEESSAAVLGEESAEPPHFQPDGGSVDPAGEEGEEEKAKKRKKSRKKPEKQQKAGGKQGSGGDGTTTGGTPSARQKEDDNILRWYREWYAPEKRYQVAYDGEKLVEGTLQREVRGDAQCYAKIPGLARRLKLASRPSGRGGGGPSNISTTAERIPFFTFRLQRNLDLVQKTLHSPFVEHLLDKRGDTQTELTYKRFLNNLNALSKGMSEAFYTLTKRLRENGGEKWAQMRIMTDTFWGEGSPTSPNTREMSLVEYTIGVGDNNKELGEILKLNFPALVHDEDVGQLKEDTHWGAFVAKLVDKAKNAHPLVLPTYEIAFHWVKLLIGRCLLGQMGSMGHKKLGSAKADSEYAYYKFVIAILCHDAGEERPNNAVSLERFMEDGVQGVSNQQQLRTLLSEEFGEALKMVRMLWMNPANLEMGSLGLVF